MTTKQDKKPVPFIKAGELIKEVKRFATAHAGYFDDLQSTFLPEAESLVRALLYTRSERLIAKDDARGYELKRRSLCCNLLHFKHRDRWVILVEKLAKRFEREFLRKERQLEIGENEALLKVSVIDLKEEIESIEEIRMHVDNPKLLNIIDQLDEWIFNTQPFNDVGLYTIKAKIEEVDCELYSSFMWDFEVIEFKPLEK